MKKIAFLFITCLCTATSIFASVQSINDNNAKNVITNNNIVVLDFYADWCGPCKKFSPVFSSVSNQFNAVFGKVNVDKSPQTADAYGIKALPTVVIIKNGVVVKKGNPPLKEEEFKKFVESAIK